ncbi:hypothetical protein FACS1894125_6470 [Actinomycetota bacterium]|nr:hypothetical protein FACS1894125_6470 [Actinomycetota bacterium]
MKKIYPVFIIFILLIAVPVGLCIYQWIDSSNAEEEPDIIDFSDSTTDSVAEPETHESGTDYDKILEMINNNKGEYSGVIVGKYLLNENSEFIKSSKDNIGTFEEIFEDKVFAACIASFLGKSSIEQTSEFELDRITSIVRGGLKGDGMPGYSKDDQTETTCRKQYSEISSVRGVENLHFLTYIDMHGTGISDISALNGLPILENVNIADTHIHDLNPLFSLPRLLWLDIDVNQSFNTNRMRQRGVNIYEKP